MIVEIQCLPSPSGTEDERYAHVHAAIEVVQEAGVHYEVGPLGTSFEGDPDVLWPLVRAVHEATMTSGANSCISVIKVAQQQSDRAATMDGLTDRYRS